MKIVLDNVSKRFPGASGTGVALEHISFTICENEFVTIVGRSGCGKTTLLNLVAGLLTPSEGRVLIDGQLVAGPGLDRSMVFQRAALFPWLTALQNVEFGPRNLGIAKSVRRAQALTLIELVGLSGFEHKYPNQLSGGMQQRVAIARALAMDPAILLMDEPFGALDELTRAEMQAELLRIWEARKKTVVFITHSIMEAIHLSDRVIVLTPHPGRIRAEFRIDLLRPRRESDSQFIKYYAAIHEAIN